MKFLNWPSLNKYRVKKIKNETGKDVPFTEEEKVRVFDYYESRNPGYHLFLLLI